MRNILKTWLKSGVMEGGQLFPTEAGSPQGGCISPLLANVALHGLEETVVKSCPNRYKAKNWRPTVVRYADDFVVLHPDLGVIEQIKAKVVEWLAPMGLELKPSKTRISHTLDSHEGEKAGFNFLGFNIRHYPQGKTHSARVGNRWGASSLTGFKLLIRPSNEGIKRHSQAIADIIHRYRSASQGQLIERLNPLIWGWTRYYSTVASKSTFSKLEHLIFLKLGSWAKHRHRGNKPWKWIAAKYWRLETGHWEFATIEGRKEDGTAEERKSLYRYYQRPIVRHIKVIETKSPYDGDWVYWASRMGRHPEVTNKVSLLLKKQKGKCGWCGLYFKDGDLKEVDHNEPLRFSRDEGRSNQVLLHRHCHDQKTAGDGSLYKRGTRDKSQTVEERNDAKVSRSVLKTSRVGDRPA